MTGYEIDALKTIIYYTPKINKSFERIADSFERMANELEKMNNEKEKTK